MIRAIRGTDDVLPGRVELWQAVEEKMRAVFDVYGFSEIRTPIFEATELFVRSVGQETDIVSKEMYTFTDRDETSSLTLRPEGTAPVVRAYIEHQMQSEARMLKLYYVGPMFRRERPQKGRYRQFMQAGVEVLSDTDHPAIEAEVIEMLTLLFERLAVPETKLIVNSIGCHECRPAYMVRLREEVRERLERLCGDCHRRGERNQLRVFDCKVASCQPAIAELTPISATLCAACRDHFERFKAYLESRQIGFEVNPRMVRGFDYYMRTTFEITSDRLGSQNAIVGGGRYDGLSEGLDGPPVKGFGFAMGLERLVLCLSDPSRLAPAGGPDSFIAPIGEGAFAYAIHLARKLRACGKRTYLDFDGRSLKSQMRLADRLGAKHVIIIGEEELKAGRLLLRDMTTKEQRAVTESDLCTECPVP